MKKRYEFDKLDPAEFKERVQKNFPAANMSILSIIQGVAIYFLVNNTFNDVVDKNLSNYLLLYPLLSLVGIIIVFYMYSYFVSITYRPPDFHEAVIPFTLGIAEIVPTQFFDEPRMWWLFYGIFCSCGTLGFINTYIGTHKEDYKEEYVEGYNTTRREMIKNIIITTLAALVSFIAFRFYPHTDDITKWHFGVHDWLPLSVVGIFMTTLILTTEFKYLRRLYRLFKLLNDK